MFNSLTRISIFNDEQCVIIYLFVRLFICEILTLVAFGKDKVFCDVFPESSTALAVC